MRSVLLLSLALLSASGLCRAQERPLPRELPTTWEAPPGDPLEHAAAGFAKVLCSALFITGRNLATAADEDGLAVSPRDTRHAITDTVVDLERQAVHLTLRNGVTRTAKLYGDQGCVILPRGADSVYFAPVRVTAALPDPATQAWPMGDLLPDKPPPAEIDAAKLTAATAAAFDPPEALTAAFVVAYKGQIIAERYGPGADFTTRLPGWSMGKSLAATLVGQLIHEGVYDLWEPAPVEEWQLPGDPRAAIRIADLLRMSSGIRFEASDSAGYPDHLYVYTGAIDAYQWAITRPLQWPPNTVGRYRNCDPLTLLYLIKQAAIARGEEYLSYPQRHVFDKLGIRRMVLETDPYGNFELTGYELGTGRDWLRLGLLYLNDGVWNGERLLPEGWVEFVRTPAPAWSEPRYGGLFWLNRTNAWPVPEDAYYMAGAGGQFTFIIPTHDLVVVRLGHAKGDDEGYPAFARALALLMEAVPQVREPWQPSSGNTR
jgi:CubicO group peptidase (beta-lactamase class C family)